MFQDGFIALNSSNQDYNVTFDVAFDAPPDVVVCQVNNVSADGTKLQINATVTSVSTTGFSVHLDALPNTNNYTMAWFATYGSVAFEVISQSVVRVTKLPGDNTRPAAADLVPIVRMSPIPYSTTIQWEHFAGLFMQYQATPPTAPTDPGEVGWFSIDANYLYLYVSTAWTRVPLQSTSSWATALTINEKRSASVALDDATQEHTITFASAFPSGNLPTPRTIVVANSVDSPVTMVAPTLITEITLSGFTVLLAAETDSANFVLHYEFEQLP